MSLHAEAGRTKLPRELNDLLAEVSPCIWRFRGQRAWLERINCYLVAADGGFYLVDCPVYTDALKRALDQAGPVRGIFLTHAATSGPAARWQEAGIPVHLNHLDREDRWLAMTPCSWMDGDTTLACGFSALHMPAHSAGHTMYLLQGRDGALFAGDGILVRGGRFAFDLNDASRRRLASLRYERLLPYHYDAIETAADERIVQALRFRR